MKAFFTKEFDDLFPYKDVKYIIQFFFINKKEAVALSISTYIYTIVKAIKLV